MCQTVADYISQELDEVGGLSDEDLLDRLKKEYQRAVWESPEDLSLTPLCAMSRLGRVIEEIEKRKSDAVL